MKRSRLSKGDFTDYLKRYWVLHAATAVIGTVVPLATFWIQLAPPYFPGAVFLSPSISLSCVVTAYFYSPASDGGGGHLPFFARRAVQFLGAFLLVTIVYWAFLRTWSVPDPQRNERVQVGFGKADWSLTDTGLGLKGKYLNEPLQQWMMEAGAFDPESAERIWTRGTIMMAGLILIAMFFVAVGCWSGCVALFARQLIEERRGRPQGRP